MSKRSWFLGIGCLGLVVLMVVAAIAVRVALQPRVPSRTVLAITLDGPIVELAADDPFAELMGTSVISLRELRAALVSAAEDERVVGVRVRMDGFGGGFAQAQEIRDLLARVRAAGKWTAAYLDTAGEGTAGNLEYYVAAACDEISLNPLGDVNLVGLAARTMFIRGTLDKLGVEPEFPGRGDYKTARFMYTNTEFTPAHREMMEWLLDSLMDQMVAGVASSRGMEAAAVRNLIDQAPFMGVEALDVGLVDAMEDWTDFLDRVEDKAGEGVSAIAFQDYAKRLAAPMTGPKIAVVTGVGGIMRGESRQELNPLFGGDVMGAETLARAWRAVRREDGVKAVIFRVDSPGGSALASEVIRLEMKRTAEEIPVVVSMSNLAASGGYWISCGAQRFVASPGTLTASIGVFSGHLNTARFWEEKLGVTYGRIDRGANANLFGDLESWTDSQRAVVDRQLDRIYDAFLDRVSESRGMSREAVDAIARGRVFTGEQALGNGLVDVLGGFDQALVEARQLAGLAPDAEVRLVDFPQPEPWWQKMLNRGRHEEVGVEAALAQVRQWVQTGTIPTPGAVWLPPIVVE